MPFDRLRDLPDRVRSKWVTRCIRNRVPWKSERPDTCQRLTSFVERVLNKLLHRDFVPNDVKIHTLRTTYEDQIIYHLSKTSGSRCQALLQDSPEKLWLLYNDWIFNHAQMSWDSFYRLRDYAEAEDPKDQDMLIAAASVGNLKALRYFAGKVSDFGDEGKIFCNVWAAVIYCDQKECLEYLLSQLHPVPVSNPRMRTLDRRVPGVDTLLLIWAALLDVCKLENVAIAKILIDFFLNQGMLWRMMQLSAGRDLDLAMRLSRVYIEYLHIYYHCIESDSVEILDYLLNKLANIEENSIRGDLTQKFEVACRDGRIKIIRYLLEHRGVLATRTLWKSGPACYDINDECVDHDYHGIIADGDRRKYSLYDPLCSAAEKCQLEAMTLLVEHGAKVPQTHGALVAAIDFTVAGPRFPTVQFLLDNGAPFDETLMEATQQFAYSCYLRSQIMTDSAMIVIILAAAMARTEIRFLNKDFKLLREVIQWILNRGIELPCTPVDFAQLGKGFVDRFAPHAWKTPWKLPPKEEVQELLALGWTADDFWIMHGYTGSDYPDLWAAEIPGMPLLICDSVFSSMSGWCRE